MTVDQQRQMQHWDPERYARNARFVSDLGLPVLELLAPAKGERILDLGCGDGALTLDLMAAGADVLGIDASSEQIGAATERGVQAIVADGTQLEFEGEFDAVFSNAVLHWMPDADAVIDGVWRALRPGGRFVGEMGGFGNVELIRSALIKALNTLRLDGEAANPWYFPTPDDYRERLVKRGPTPLPGPMADWLETFAEPFIKVVPEPSRPALIRSVCQSLEPDLLADGVWTADYVRLRFAASKPA